MKSNRNIFYGSKLKLARNLQGYTLGEIGQRISASRQYLQRLESDPGIFPAENMIEALSVVLHVEPHFFYSPLTGEVPEEVCHFRKRKTTTLRLQKKALAYGTVFSWIVSYLETHLALPNDIISGSELSVLKNIELAATQCRLAWGLSADAPIGNVVRAIENSGGVVTSFDGVSQEIDAFSYFASRPIVVRNKAKESNSRARFDLAHELGHLLLHHDLDADNPELEDEANRFAIAFLLPQIQFAKEFPRYARHNWWRELCDMKCRWGVSLQAIIRRAYDLRLIDSVAYRNAYIYINKKGWKLDEPCEENIASETSDILPTSLGLLRIKGITPLDIAKRFHVRPSILFRFGIEMEDAGTPFEDNNIISMDDVRRRQNNKII